ncbi:vesicular, overexpressed in cancer, prosurvival protein 1 isoform X2 [Heterocephalus glaber]|uniref:WW domain binding protein VOPP1 n=1 Tax=Heterocephalus glaber TaxID=10181 RepID=A0AAX6SN44_HETGA|nr:vesicular, overexpressed in cancer, prosurvival protein 1 isoform X2 [Heterocephalus glaber]
MDYGHTGSCSIYTLSERIYRHWKPAYPKSKSQHIPCSADYKAEAPWWKGVGSKSAQLLASGNQQGKSQRGRGRNQMESLPPTRPPNNPLAMNSSRCIEAKKHCWYFEGLYPTYYICRSYEDCCGSRCCVRALSIQRLWYFWSPAAGAAILH